MQSRDKAQRKLIKQEDKDNKNIHLKNCLGSGLKFFSRIHMLKELIQHQPGLKRTTFALRLKELGSNLDTFYRF